MKLLYFAYGSNMSSKRLRKRIHSAKPLHRASLSHHELRFHKKSRDGSAKCNAFHTADPSHQIQGVIYEILETHKSQLDRFEGVGKGYEAEWVSVTTSHGLVLEAFTYLATDLDDSLSPYHWYKEHVLIGAREHDLPGKYIKRIAAITSIDDPDKERHFNELGIYDL